MEIKEGYAFGHFHKDGGDLGRNPHAFHELQLYAIFRVTSEIMSALPYGPFKYAVEVPGFVKEELVKFYCRECEPGVGLYEVDGRVLFDIRGDSGGVTTNKIFYIIQLPR